MAWPGFGGPIDHLPSDRVSTITAVAGQAATYTCALCGKSERLYRPCQCEPSRVLARKVTECSDRIEIREFGSPTTLFHCGCGNCEPVERQSPPRVGSPLQVATIEAQLAPLMERSDGHKRALRTFLHIAPWLVAVSLMGVGLMSSSVYLLVLTSIVSSILATVQISVDPEPKDAEKERLFKEAMAEVEAIPAVAALKVYDLPQTIAGKHYTGSMGPN